MAIQDAPGMDRTANGYSLYTVGHPWRHLTLDFDKNTKAEQGVAPLRATSGARVNADVQLKEMK
ncbi:MAG: hypothetical protein ACOX3F_05780 [Kiritimatiellia bacterium]